MGADSPSFSYESVRSGWGPSSHLVTTMTVRWLTEDGLGQREEGEHLTPDAVVWQ